MSIAVLELRLETSAPDYQAIEPRFDGCRIDKLGRDACLALRRASVETADAAVDLVAIVVWELLA